MSFFYILGAACAAAAAAFLPFLLFDNLKQAWQQRNQYQDLKRTILKLLLLTPLVSSFFPQGKQIMRVLIGVLLAAYWIIR